jgi:hypothetical protein
MLRCLLIAVWRLQFSIFLGLLGAIDELSKCLLSALHFVDALAAHWKALNFLACVALKLDSTRDLQETTFGPFHTKVFLPRRLPSRSSPTAVVVHGLADSGYDDARVVSFARALASASGLRVLVPAFPRLQGCELSSACIDDIAHAYNLVSAHAEHCPSGRLVVAGFCVPATFAMIAATHTADSAGVVDALLLFGPYADLSSLAEHAAVSGGKGDAKYGANVIFANSWGKGDPVYRKLFLAALTDDHYLKEGSEEAELPGVLFAFPEHADAYKKVHSSPTAFASALRTAFATPEAQMTCAALSPGRDAGLTPGGCAATLREHGLVSLTVAHAAVDDIVPAAQSAGLAEEVAAEGIFVSRYVTTLLNKGEVQALGVESVFEIVRLARALALFFRNQKMVARERRARGEMVERGERGEIAEHAGHGLRSDEAGMKVA